MTVTPETAQAGRPPALWGRRLVARLLDWLIAGLATAAICWPLAWGQATDALARAGVSSAGDLLETQRLDGTLDPVLAELQPVIVLALTAQLLLVWLYEALATVLTGTTVGKALLRLRVVVERGDRIGVERSDRTLRLALRAALVTGPPGVAVVTLGAAEAGVPDAAEVSMAAIAVTIGSLIVGLPGGRGLHGDLTRTRVVPLDWAQVQADARSRAREAGTRVQTVGRDRVGPQVDRLSAQGRQSLTEGRQALARGQQAPEGLVDSPLGRLWSSLQARWQDQVDGDRK